MVGDVIVVHLVVDFIAEIPTKEGEVDSLLQGGTPNFLHQWNPGDVLTAVRDHVERLLVIAQCHNQVRRLDISPEDGSLHSAFPSFSS